MRTEYTGDIDYILVAHFEKCKLSFSIMHLIPSCRKIEWESVASLEKLYDWNGTIHFNNWCSKT